MVIVDLLAFGFVKVIIYPVITETHNLVQNEDEPLTILYVYVYRKFYRYTAEFRI